MSNRSKLLVGLSLTALAASLFVGNQATEKPASVPVACHITAADVLKWKTPEDAIQAAINEDKINYEAASRTGITREESIVDMGNHEVAHGALTLR